MNIDESTQENGQDIEDDEEVKTDEVVLEEDEIIEETTTTSDNEIQDGENLNKTKDDGVLDFEAVRVDWDKIEGEIYDAEELYELVENSPSFFPRFLSGCPTFCFPIIHICFIKSLFLNY